jgi:hypothetical protein
MAAVRSASRPWRPRCPSRATRIEDIIEPYLIQCGPLQRTPRGRLLTPAAFAHIGLTAPENWAAGLGANQLDLLGDDDV